MVGLVRQGNRGTTRIPKLRLQQMALHYGVSMELSKVYYICMRFVVHVSFASRGLPLLSYKDLNIILSTRLISKIPWVLLLYLRDVL